VKDRRFEELVTIGRVVKPQGLKGELLVEPLSDLPGRFPGLRRGFVPGKAELAREIRIVGCRPHQGRFALKLEGVDTIDQAETYRGIEIRIGEEDLPALPEGCYYHHQLRGLRVERPTGEPVGTVAAVMEAGGGTPVLVVRGGREEVLIPLAERFVRRVDLSAGVLVAEVSELEDAAGSPSGEGRRGRRHAGA